MERVVARVAAGIAVANPVARVPGVKPAARMVEKMVRAKVKEKARAKVEKGERVGHVGSGHNPASAATVMIVGTSMQAPQVVGNVNILMMVIGMGARSPN